MKYIDEYRNADDAERFVQLIHRTVTKPWTIMEICGGQTHTLVKFGIDRMLPPEVTLVHGPGCPVCVTPLALDPLRDRHRPAARSDSPPLATCCACRIHDRPAQRQGQRG